MIKENQTLLNQLNILSDGLIVLVLLPLSFWLRFYVLPGGEATVSYPYYQNLALILAIIHVFTFACFGLYSSHRKISLSDELKKLWVAEVLDTTILLSFLFLRHQDDYSRFTLAIFFVSSGATLSLKRILLRKGLRKLRQQGFNQKHVLIVGSGNLAQKYLKIIQSKPEYGYHPIGYLSDKQNPAMGIAHLGTLSTLDSILDSYVLDEVISAIDSDNIAFSSNVILACEKAGVKLSIIPFYSDYMTSNPTFDEIDGLPLLNIRRIPLDNWANAFLKRTLDIVASLLLIIVTSPIMLICAIGVRLSSPGPILFRQERVGLNRKPFSLYKFRSMRMNSTQNTGWSSNHDDRKTRFGSFIRKCSLDEFPQFFNVLKGDMSLVGPRPEVPFFVEQFKEEIPLYMVKHQVRPGITGWAQVNGLRGDTSIEERIQYDIYYIENWGILFDLKILLITVFGGKFLNKESLKG